MSILWLLKEHSKLTFEELADFSGADDYIELQTHLKQLEEKGLITKNTSIEDLTTYQRAVSGDD